MLAWSGRRKTSKEMLLLSLPCWDQKNLRTENEKQIQEKEEETGEERRWGSFKTENGKGGRKGEKKMKQEQELEEGEEGEGGGRDAQVQLQEEEEEERLLVLGQARGLTVFFACCWWSCTGAAAALLWSREDLEKHKRLIAHRFHLLPDSSTIPPPCPVPSIIPPLETA